MKPGTEKVREWAELVRYEHSYDEPIRDAVYAACLAYGAYLRGLLEAENLVGDAMETLGIPATHPRRTEESGDPAYEVAYASLCATETWHSVLKSEGTE